MAALLGSMRFCLRCSCRAQQHKYTFASVIHNRKYSDLVVNHKWDLDPCIREYLKENSSKHRSHPGIVTVRRVQLPNRLKEAINILIEKYPTKDLEKKSEELNLHLWSRHKPVENEEVQSQAEIVEAQIREKENIDVHQLTVEERDVAAIKVKNRVLKSLKQKTYHWKAIEYDAYQSFLYLVGRMAIDYSCLYQIFSEIAKRDPDFKPLNLFDFGSGVGSTVWAANSVWSKSLQEHFCVDISNDMNTVARLLIQDGEEEKEPSIPGVYFRQHMPVSLSRKHELVVSAFSLMELPSQQDRLNTLYALWRKTEKYLVIVENGTNAGFLTVLEARDFILQFGNNTLLPEKEREELMAHVFSPCPHDMTCPRMQRNDGTPCNFSVGYKSMSTKKNEETRKIYHKYSYVVLRKGVRPQGAAWPRIVRETSSPSKRVHIRTCTPDGELQVSILTAAKHGRDLYWCGRACKWGDLLPVVPPSEEEEVTQFDPHSEITCTDSMRKNKDHKTTADEGCHSKTELSQTDPIAVS